MWMNLTCFCLVFMNVLKGVDSSTVERDFRGHLVQFFHLSLGKFW